MKGAANESALKAVRRVAKVTDGTPTREMGTSAFWQWRVKVFKFRTV